jgi:hypothetical protein
LVWFLGKRSGNGPLLPQATGKGFTPLKGNGFDTHDLHILMGPTQLLIGIEFYLGVCRI